MKLKLNNRLPHTMPIESELKSKDLDWFYNNYMQFSSALPRPLVKAHKNRLGEQSYTSNNGEFRFWVWEWSDFRVYVNNHKGIVFEVRPGLIANQIKQCWQIYRSSMGYPDIP